MRNIRTWDSETLRDEDMPYWWPSPAEYDYDKFGFLAQINGLCTSKTIE